MPRHTPYKAEPPAPGRSSGRPSRMYYDLFEQVAATHGADVWVVVKEFRGRQSAKEALDLIVAWKRPVPGGVGRWEMAARTFKFKDKETGVDKTGSRLHVKWKGPR